MDAACHGAGQIPRQQQPVSLSPASLAFASRALALFSFGLQPSKPAGSSQAQGHRLSKWVHSFGELGDAGCLDPVPSRAYLASQDHPHQEFSLLMAHACLPPWKTTPTDAVCMGPGPPSYQLTLLHPKTTQNSEGPREWGGGGKIACSNLAFQVVLKKLRRGPLFSPPSLCVAELGLCHLKSLPWPSRSLPSGFPLPARTPVSGFRSAFLQSHPTIISHQQTP